jgi:cell fate regulator YaaT (PSP1 superfamily)
VEAAERTYVSVRFSPAGRVQRFLLAEGVEPPPTGADVVVRTETGAALGRVDTTIPHTADRRPVPDGTSPLRVVRRASQADIVARLKHEQREREARLYAMDRIRAHDLPMKLSRVEQPFDGSRLTFYFTAETRIDFRELVRDLAARFRTRV